MTRRLLSLIAILALAPPLLHAQSRDSTLVAHLKTRTDSIEKQALPVIAPYFAAPSTSKTRKAAYALLLRQLAAVKAEATAFWPQVTPTPIPPKPAPDSVIVVKPDTVTPSPIQPGIVTLATLPLSTPSAAYPTGLTAVPVAAGADLQAAMDGAPCNAELQLAPGATYSGNFVWKVRPCAGTLVIRTGSGALKPAGTRITPATSASSRQARIVSPNNISAIQTATGAHDIYLEDVEVSCPVDLTNSCVNLGVTQTTLPEVPQRIVLRHDWIHGTATTFLRRCVYLNSGTTAIVDSWASDCHDNNTDSQAILGGNGPGPYLIENNYLESGGEVIMFGGFDPMIPGLVASDITIRHNHITRPLSWRGVWQVKNLIESKNARRMLVEGNVIENNWADGQTGYWLNAKSVNQNGSAPWSTSQDITVRDNLIRNVGAGINLCAACQNTVVPATRMTISNNLTIGVNDTAKGEARELQLLGALTDIAITHNTTIGGVGVETAISLDGQPPKIARLEFRSNVYDAGLYNWHFGSGCSPAIPCGIDTTQARIDYNRAIGSECGGSQCVASMSALGVDARGVLSATSPYRLPTHDGAPLGADAARIYALTAGVVVSDPSRALGAGPRRIATAQQSRYRPTSKADREWNTRH